MDADTRSLYLLILMLNSFGIFLVRYRAEPCILVGLRIAFDSQMREPAVRGRSVPMHHIRCYFDHIAGFKPPSRFAFLLIVAFTTDTDKQLSSGMAVPVIAASRLECHVRYRYIQFLNGGQRSQP